MSNADLKAGDRVRLSPNTKWRIGEYNPLDCIGEVRIDGHDRIWVKWGKGRSSWYRLTDDDLILVESQIDDPSNITLSNTTW